MTMNENKRKHCSTPATQIQFLTLGTYLFTYKLIEWHMQCAEEVHFGQKPTDKN